MPTPCPASSVAPMSVSTPVHVAKKEAQSVEASPARTTPGEVVAVVDPEVAVVVIASEEEEEAILASAAEEGD